MYALKRAASLFSFLVTWGEVAVGLGVLLGVLTGIAAGFGVLMNLNYLLAGTVSINPVLGTLGLFLCFAWRVCGWIGFDHHRAMTARCPSIALLSGCARRRADHLSSSFRGLRGPIGRGFSGICRR